MKLTRSHNPLGEPKSTSSKWLICLGVLAIVLATFIAYLPAIGGGFIWDDDDYVSENLLLQNFSGLADIWLLRPMTTRDGQRYLNSNTPQYYPLVFSTFWLESRLWDQNNPTGFHIVNILLHIANALLVWLICRRLGFAWAFFAGAVFALHPVGVESVAWITERKNVLSGLFYMLALLSYLRFDKSKRKLFYFTALGCFVFALLSKTVTCSLPAILLLILWLRHRRLAWSDLLRLIPFFAVGALFGLFTAYLEHYRVGAVGAEWEIAFWRRCVIAGQAIFFYASKLLWPVNLTFIYPRWNPDEFSPLHLLWPAAAIALTVLLWSRRKAIGWAPLIAWAAFIITLFPALGFINVYPFRFSFVADHFQYLASIFFIALLVGLGHSLYKSLCTRGFKVLTLSSVRVILSSIVLLLLGYLTYAQALMYEDVESLWKTTIHRNPKAWIAWSNRGALYLSRGDYEQTIRDSNEAIRLNPKVADAYNNRGGAYASKGDYKQAIQDFDKAIELDYNQPQAYYNRASAYLDKGKYNHAIRDFDKAIKLNPGFAMAYNNRGIVYSHKGEYKQAIGDYSKAIELNPSYADVCYNRGVVYRLKGAYDLAIRDLNRAIELDPSHAKAYYNRGLTYRIKGECDLSIRDFNRAIELDPSHAQAYYNRGNTYLAKGEYKRAIHDLNRAIELNPGHAAKAYNDLAWILAKHEDSRVRDGTRAVQLAKKACELTGYRAATTLDTLAAAYAEVGEFDKAVKTAERAFLLARDSGKDKLTKDIRSRLELYKAKRPYRESFSSEDPGNLESK